MARFTVHMSMNLEGLLRNCKRKKITIFDDENGNPISDKEARIYIQECLDKGWKLIPMCGEDICEGFDHFEKGCPHHELKQES